MSDTPDDAFDSADSYTVGYKRPPQETRFKKGQSGNPHGRRRKIKPFTKPIYYTGLIADLAFEEAMRPVKLMENGQEIELPMVQAILRAEGIAGLKGNQRARNSVLRRLEKHQAADEADLRNAMKAASEYRLNAREIIEDCKRKGRPEPELLPHPDEIVIDVVEGEIRYNGPSGDLDKGKWGEADNGAVRRQKEIRRLRRELAKESDPEERRLIEYHLRTAEFVAQKFLLRYPDKLTRRQPSFDLRAWRRERAPTLRRLAATYREWAEKHLRALHDDLGVDGSE